MFGLPLFFTESSEQRRRRATAEKARLEKRIAETMQLWTPEAKWQPELCFDAKSYNAWVERFNLFGPEPLPENPKNLYYGKAYSVSPQGRFCYARRELPRGAELQTFCGNRKGTVIFDAPVMIPTLNDLTWYDPRENIWMSLTPMEVMTLRAGTKKARGHVVVAGLGLGYQLIGVSQRKKVTRITLVERERELVDWIMPELKPLLGPTPIDIVIGDAKVELPKLEADIALVDIDRGYGSNTFFARCDKIRNIWVWGAAVVGGSIWD